MTWRLVAVPALIAFGITVIRLIGEIAGASDTWFTIFTLPRPDHWKTVAIGIGWLPAPFGAWFAWRLVRSGAVPPSRNSALLLSLVGFALSYVAPYELHRAGLIGFATSERAAIVVGSAALAFVAWPALARTAAVYGFLAAIPVVVVTFLAMDEGWRTHYNLEGLATFTAGGHLFFVRRALIDELEFGVALTVVLAAFTGSLTAMAVPRPPTLAGR